MEKYLGGLRKYFDDEAPSEPSLWTFAGLQRNKEGRYADEDLVRLLRDGCENVAGKMSGP